MPRRRTTTLALLAVLLLLGACGDSSDSDAGTDGGAAQSGGPGESIEASTNVVGGRTLLKLDSRLERVLDVAGVDIRPIGGAKEIHGGFRFPIAAGDLDIDTLSGRMQHDGGLRFEAAGQALEASDFVVRPGDGLLTAEIAGRRVPLMSLDFGRPVAPPTSDSIVFDAPTAELAVEAVAPLNDRVGLDLLDAGLDLGAVRVEARRP